MSDLSESSSQDRTATIAMQLLTTYASTLIERAEKVDLGGGVRAAAVEMDHAALVAFVIEVISETWFYHPELLGPFAGAVIRDKVAEGGVSREDYDGIARPSTFILAAGLAGTLDMDNLPEQLGQFGLGPHAVDD